MTDSELIITALAELWTHKIAEAEKALGLKQNARARKTKGTVSKNAWKELEVKAGKSVVTEEIFLPPKKAKAQIDKGE